MTVVERQAHTMRTNMDAFIEAVESARQRLIRQEGRNVSGRELLRRAGFTDKQRPTVSYHLNPNRHTGAKPHNVPFYIVERLAAVLPVSQEELAAAARVAAGYSVREDEPGPELTYMVQRFYDDEDISPEEQARVTARLLQIIAEVTSRGNE